MHNKCTLPEPPTRVEHNRKHLIFVPVPIAARTRARRRFNSRQHRCPRPGCGRVFDRPSKLAAHEKTHEARFVCQFSGCGAAFVLASGLNLHLKEEHPFRSGAICGMYSVCSAAER